jgi:hypothetical protein
VWQTRLEELGIPHGEIVDAHYGSGCPSATPTTSPWNSSHRPHRRERPPTGRDRPAGSSQMVSPPDDRKYCWRPPEWRHSRNLMFSIARGCAPGPQGRPNRPSSTISPGVGRRRRPIDGP